MEELLSVWDVIKKFSSHTDHMQNISPTLYISNIASCEFICRKEKHVDQINWLNKASTDFCYIDCKTSTKTPEAWTSTENTMEDMQTYEQDYGTPGNTITTLQSTLELI